MKAVVYTGPGQLEYRQVLKPKIKVDEILLKTKSVGICGTDLHAYKGGLNLPVPAIFGHEFSGVIAEVGAHVKNFKKGDRVTAEHIVNCGHCYYCLSGKPNLCANSQVIGLQLPGALAEYVAIPARLVYKLPKNLTFVEGAMIEPLSIAYYASEKAGSLLNRKVAVIGQGPIGLFLDQILHSSGAEVIGLDIAQWRLKFAKKNKWIDLAINNAKQEPAKIIKKKYPSGVDIVFEVVGSTATAELALELARRNGQVFNLGVFESVSKINLMNIVKKELIVRGSWTCAFAFQPAIELVAEKKIDLKTMVSHQYPVSRAIQAFKDAVSYKDNRIKTVINF